MSEICLKILSDVHCEVYVDDEYKTVASKDTLTKVYLKKGQYYVQFISTVNSNYKINKIIELDYDIVVQVQFLELVEKCQELERDSDFGCYGKYRVIKNLITGKEIQVEYDLDDISLDHGLIKVRSALKYGMVDKFGNTVIPCIYDWIGRFNYNIPDCKTGVAPAEIGNNWGYIDCHGNILVSFKYSSADFFSYKGIAAVALNGRYGHIDYCNKEITPFIYEKTTGHAGLSKVKMNNKWGAVNEFGEEVIPCIYDSLGYFHEGLAAVERYGKYGFVNINGDLVVPYIFDNVGSFNEGLAWYRNSNDKCGYINKCGQEIISALYDDADEFINGKAIVWNQDMGYGVIDNTGFELIPCNNRKVKRFINGYWGICKGWHNWDILDSNNEIVMSVVGYDILSMGSGLLEICKEGFFEDERDKLGYMNLKNEIVIPVEFDSCIMLDNIIRTTKGDAIYYFDKYGNEL